jgi:hypothetical protein
MELLYLDLMMVLPGEAAFAFVPYGSGQLTLIGHIYLKGQVYELQSNNVCVLNSGGLRPEGEVCSKMGLHDIKPMMLCNMKG